ncbi:DUF2461 domain-containing protein [Aquimarina sp. U1-2]|uniref:DUF2461 domain-containing protein n=1 Tax=Aquimarina sp. U1-2 TaxID=2823141 RepID=UPI001AEC7FE8|nr:DUF2461 domain-containing protein [Aquimarina sp. U1-2]MBP2831070.1 DUF2461 domain-containing protein [Aquimarina sp. U1-2]
MVQKEYIFRFLRDLSNNNAKDWMDKNRERYHTAKERWLKEVSLILERLEERDSYFEQFKPKDTIMRINNNRRFQPDKPIYKDYFTCSPMTKESKISKIHISVGVGGCFIGGGLHRPDNNTLKKVRDAIDYDGEKLQNIIEEKDFQKHFGGLAEDDQKLKTSPRGYSDDHEHIELLRYKNILAKADITQELVASDDFVDFVEDTYLKLQPLNEYLERAIS